MAVRRLSSLKPFTNAKTRPSVVPSLATVPSEKEENYGGETGDNGTEKHEQSEEERSKDDQLSKHVQENGDSAFEGICEHLVLPLLRISFLFFKGSFRSKVNLRRIDMVAAGRSFLHKIGLIKLTCKTFSESLKSRSSFQSVQIAALPKSEETGDEENEIENSIGELLSGKCVVGAMLQKNRCNWFPIKVHQS